MPLDFRDSIVIFCDGACSGNPGPGGWGAIVAGPDGQVEELGGGSPATTNNRMELLGSIFALRSVAHLTQKVFLFTDSVYVIRGITQWVFGWRKRGWKTAEGKDVANQDLWEDLLQIVTARGKAQLEWGYVRGHTGVPGNERCDVIAVSFSKKESIELYKGPLLRYEVPLYDLPESTALPEMKERVSGQVKAQAYSYLSLLHGAPMKHASWGECERRVKGQSGAKFKKAMSETDEVAILKSWGVNLKK